MTTLHHQTKDRLAWREKVARDLGVVIKPPLSFRAARFASMHSGRDELVHWLLRPSTVNTRGFGRKTYTELCMAFGLAIPAKAPRTIGRKLAEAQKRCSELEQIIHDLRIENSGQAAEIEKLRQACDKAREALASVLCAEEPPCPTYTKSRCLCVEALQALNKLTELNTN